jgi:lysophospholipase L1-like esterase
MVDDMVQVLPGDRYVAMGSSYAAGPGLGKRAAGSPKRAGRSSVNYAHVLAERLQLDLRDVTYSGATVAELLHGSSNGEPPQIDAVTSDARFVTITGGGNDVGYIPRITSGSAPFPISALPGVRRLARSFDSQDVTNSKFGALHDDFAALVREVHHRAPGATVALVEYLPVLPSDTSVDLGSFPRDLADWGRGTYARLSTLTAGLAEVEGCLFVRVSDAAANHHAWAPEPWTRRFELFGRSGAPYHPNRAGMSAVADVIERALHR